ncbi:hypothetical protein ACFSPU_12810 [Haoranjiania flava]|uniref:Phosphoribosylpyrophosphate synthetase n=1 Tax=Haoranjiania flava TaxID=1856322 RepID=A0AAE3IQN2_9BACT|nr:hypothetical protein [Haoranjiania flava]MCU7695391.1 hypothetical protein [Haoranjiania flava]
MQPQPMTTLTEVLNSLRKKGIDSEIKLNDANEMQHDKSGKIFKPEELTIIKTYRFEGQSDPGDNSALYIVKDAQGNKSFILDTYGAYSDNPGPKFDDFLKQIPVEEVPEL